MAARRNKHGLTTKQERFAAGYACHGLTLSDAYRRAYSTSKMDNKTVWNEAHLLIKHHAVAKRVDELLAEMRVEDIVSGQKILRRTVDGFEQAIDDGNLTAAASFADKLLKVKGLMRDRLSVEGDQAMSDDELVKALSGGDEAKARILKQVIASDGFTPDVVAEPDHEDDKTGTDG